MDAGPPNGATRVLSDPPPPGTMINHTPADILHELSKLEPFDSTTGSWPDFADRLQEHFDLFNVASEKRVRILIDRISNATYEKLSEICKPLAPLDKPFDELWAIMDKNFNKYSNKFKERVKFNRRYQRAHENVLKYATELKRWGKNCKFPESWWHQALITQFINGIRSDAIRAKLFDLRENDFDQLVNFASNIEGMLESLKAAENSTNAADAAKKPEPQASNAPNAPKNAKKKKANPNQTGEGTSQVAVGKNQPANQNKSQPTNQSKPTNQNKIPTLVKSKNQIKKQNANQSKFQNKNQYKSQNTQPYLNYSNQPGGQFGDEFKNVLRNQYKDLPSGGYSSYNYDNQSVSSTYQPNSTLFYR